jgi:hypothetical protein
MTIILESAAPVPVLSPVDLAVKTLVEAAGASERAYTPELLSEMVSHAAMLPMLQESVAEWAKSNFTGKPSEDKTGAAGQDTLDKNAKVLQSALRTYSTTFGGIPDEEKSQAISNLAAYVGSASSMDEDMVMSVAGLSIRPQEFLSSIKGYKFTPQMPAGKDPPADPVSKD